MVKEILRILPRMGDKTYWFHLDRTIMEFQGLLDTLLLAKERHGKEVRIKGE
jgi:hypothetical protein